MTDQQNRTGYISRKHQFQFDDPVPTDTIFKSGFTVCSNGSLGVGGSEIFYSCLNRTFYNIYNAPIDDQCFSVYVEVTPVNGGAASQVFVSTASALLDLVTVTQISDGQPVAVTTVASLMQQISDGPISDRPTADTTTTSAKISSEVSSVVSAGMPLQTFTADSQQETVSSGAANSVEFATTANALLQTTTATVTTHIAEPSLTVPSVTPSQPFTAESQQETDLISSATAPISGNAPLPSMTVSNAPPFSQSATTESRTLTSSRATAAASNLWNAIESALTLGGSSTTQAGPSIIQSNVVIPHSSQVVSVVAVPARTSTPVSASAESIRKPVPNSHPSNQQSDVDSSMSQVYTTGSMTLLAGSAAVTISGTVYSLETGAPEVVMGSLTSLITRSNTAAPLIVGSSTITANSASHYIFASRTLEAGGLPIVVSGTTYQLMSSATALITDGTSTSTLRSGTSPTMPPPLEIGSAAITPNSATEYVVGTQTLSPGGPAITWSGTHYSLASGAYALVVGTSTDVIASQTGMGEYIWSGLGGQPGPSSIEDPSSSGTASSTSVSAQSTGGGTEPTGAPSVAIQTTSGSKRLCIGLPGLIMWFLIGAALALRLR